MEEKELKTSVKQRIVIGLIAVIMVGSMVASYAAIVINGSNSSSTSNKDDSSKISDEKVLEYENDYAAKLAEFQELTAGDWAVFSQYRSEVKAYNENAANENDVTVRDLYAGSGRTLAEGDTDYLAYYIGWCADESVFDSSLDNVSSPSGFSKALDASLGLIEGWNIGVEGMRLGGVREITIPGELAYKDQMEICGGYNKPLRFLVMPIANEGKIAGLSRELDIAYMRVQYAHYGIDYDDISQ